MKANEKPTAEKKPEEKLVEYVVESGAVGIPIPGSKGLTMYLPGSTIMLKPSIAKRMLLNKGRPKSVVDAETAAMNAATKAAAEAAGE